MTGVHFWISFKERNRLSIRTPEATSLERATTFNHYTADKFYDNLWNVMDEHKFECQDIYNVDETGCTSVQKSGNVVAAKGVRLVEIIISGERGQLVTVTYAVNAVGNVFSPLLFFLEKILKSFLSEEVL